ncbi:MAG: hypothetical protein M3Y67_07925, partial [Pseudomonadota bacterium]|nr:hypothetical protein [Pseudomonadota bacterium]
CSTALCGAGIVDAAASLAGLAPAPAPAPSPGWSKIADEGQNFSVSGTQTVRYGSGDYWIAKDVTSGGACTNAYFGTDPIVGTFKQCQVSASAPPQAPPAPPPPPSSGWSKVASEGENFSVNGSQVVRYGSGSNWVTKTVTNSGACTNAFFGSDPLYGVAKQCEVSSAASPPPANAWSRIASEGDGFGVNGTQIVRYGSGSNWVTKSVTNSGACTNAFFGNDPLYGVVKQCEVSSSG